MPDKSQDEQNQKDDKQYFRNPGSGRGNAAETKNTCDGRDDQEYQSVLQH
jgi:hypothetical protein